MTKPVIHDGREWNNAAEDTIHIVDPDPSWGAKFMAESQALGKVLRPFQPRIEHFGSTAVPNLPAKPIIDIFVILDDVAVWPQLITPISSLGYVYWEENPRPDRMFFVKGMPPHGPGRSHHVHVRTPPDVVSELRFRDWLRAHPADTARYATLKRDLAERFKSNRDAYTAAKTEFIQAMLARGGG